MTARTPQTPTAFERLRSRLAAHGHLIAAMFALAAGATAFIPWIASGNGATLSLLHLGDAVIAEVGEGRVSWWVGLLVYFIPLWACLAVLAAGVHERRGLIALRVTSTALFVCVAVAHGVLWHFHRPPSSAAFASAAFSLLATATAWLVCSPVLARSPEAGDGSR